MVEHPIPYRHKIPEDRSKALELVREAHNAERAGQYKDAFNLHTRGGNLLLKVIAHGTKKSVERRLDKLCLRASKERREVLRAAAEGTGPPPANSLPSSVTMALEMANPQGKIMLSLVRTFILKDIILG
jgi:hypothetical protein